MCNIENYYIKIELSLIICRLHICIVIFFFQFLKKLSVYLLGLFITTIQIFSLHIFGMICIKRTGISIKCSYYNSIACIWFDYTLFLCTNN